MAFSSATATKIVDDGSNKRDIMEKLICQDCGGMGGYTEPITAYGEGPFVKCGWCSGKGYVTPKDRGLWLLYKKLDKLERKEN